MINYIMVYILSILFTGAFVFYQKYQFKDLRNQRNTKWKTWANVMKGLFFLSFLVPHKTTWQDVNLAISISALQFEFMYNKVVLKVDWFFYGNSSLFDKLKNWKWVVLFLSLILSLITKFIL